MKEKRPIRKQESCRAAYPRKDKAQSTLEYAVVIVVVVAALLAMQVYLKRGLQGRLRAQAQELGEQYAPKETTGSTSLSYNSRTRNISRTLSEAQLNTDLDEDGKIEDDVFASENLSILEGSSTTQKGDETVGPLESSLP